MGGGDNGRVNGIRSFKKNTQKLSTLFQGLNKEGEVLRIIPQLPRTMYFFPFSCSIFLSINFHGIIFDKSKICNVSKPGHLRSKANTEIKTHSNLSIFTIKSANQVQNSIHLNLMLVKLLKVFTAFVFSSLSIHFQVALVKGVAPSQGIPIRF